MKGPGEEPDIIQGSVPGCALSGLGGKELVSHGASDGLKVDPDSIVLNLLTALSPLRSQSWIVPSKDLRNDLL